MSSTESITGLLVRWGRGEQQALEALTPLVYQELRRLAGRHLQRERRDHTLESTALVHEAYLKLVDQRSVQWQNRNQSEMPAAAIARACPDLRAEGLTNLIVCTERSLADPQGRSVSSPPKKNPKPRIESQCGQEYMISFLTSPEISR